MKYDYTYISDQQVPRASTPLFQHVVDTYASEINKTCSVWHMFAPEDLAWRAHPRSSTVGEIMQHELLSQRRFFSEFLGSPEPAASDVLPADRSIDEFTRRLIELALPRLDWLSRLSESEWLQPTRFFDAPRERIWVFWRRILHTAHHRTQLTVCLRLLNKTVPPTYGPTADVTWSGADPTLTV
jgi:uncharacterized damage-inducible protein DinB